MNILITGASSGIGAALALAYADAGNTLFLSGRDAARLKAVVDACTAKGARAYSRIIDVTDRAAMAAYVAECDALAELDLVIANAGVGMGGGQAPTDEDITTARTVYDVNTGGVLNTVEPALVPFGARGRGQIALVASLAGYVGLASSPMYAATKNFVKAYGEGLRGSMAPFGIRVNVICPGFVESGITARNHFPMPFFMGADKAARIIKRGLTQNRARIAFPWPMVFGVWFLSILPGAALDHLSRQLPKK